MGRYSSRSPPRWRQCSTCCADREVEALFTRSRGQCQLCVVLGAFPLEFAEPHVDTERALELYRLLGSILAYLIALRPEGLRL